MNKTTYTCDIEGCGKEAENKGTDLQVIFLTEQNEGRMCEPHLYDVRIDICNDCMKKITSGNYVFAHGAQGANTYFFKTKKKNK
jgi:hypothetical protein